MGRGRKHHTNYVSIATLQDNATHPPVVAIATASVATASVATLRDGAASLQDGAITHPVVVAIATARVAATLQDKPIRSLHESLAPHPTRSVITAPPPVRSVNATPPVRSGSAPHDVNLSNDDEFANASYVMRKGQSSNVSNTEQQSGNTLSGRVPVLPERIAQILIKLAEALGLSISFFGKLFASQAFWQFVRCSGNGYRYVTLSQLESNPNVWTVFLHGGVNITVYINAQNPERLRIAPPNLEWMRDVTLPEAITFLNDYMNGNYVFERAPQPQQPVQPFTSKDGDFPSNAMGARAPASGRQGQLTLASIVSGAGSTGPAPSTVVSAPSSVVRPAVARTNAPEVVASAVAPQVAPKVSPASGVSRTSLPVAPQVAPQVAPASSVSQTSPAVAPTVVAPVAVAPVAVAPAVAPEVAPEDPERLAFKKQQEIAMEKFDLIQNHKKMVLASEAKLAAAIAALGVDKQS